MNCVHVFQCGLNDVLWKEVFNQILKSKQNKFDDERIWSMPTQHTFDTDMLKYLWKIILKLNIISGQFKPKSFTGILLKTSSKCFLLKWRPPLTRLNLEFLSNVVFRGPGLQVGSEQPTKTKFKAQTVNYNIWLCALDLAVTSFMDKLVRANL